MKNSQRVSNHKNKEDDGEKHLKVFFSSNVNNNVIMGMQKTKPKQPPNHNKQAKKQTKQDADNYGVKTVCQNMHLK